MRNANVTLDSGYWGSKGGAMKKRDPLHTCQPCNKETGPQYLGDPEQIEEFLGSRYVKETTDQSGKMDGLQPQEEIDAIPKETK